MFTLLALMSAGANAHGVHGNVHKAEPKVAYVHHSAAQEKQSQAVLDNITSKAEANLIDTCDHSHCGHAQLAGLLARDGSDWNIGNASNAPTPRTTWASSQVTSDIERPKWPATTLAVVDLLS